jgi:hypothetical protein
MKAFQRGEYVDGFVDSNGKFYDRQQALGLLRREGKDVEPNSDGTKEAHSTDVFPMQKAWPKDEAENIENQKGFLNSPAAVDHYMENVPNATPGPSNVVLPNIPEGDPLLPEFMSSKAAARGHVDGEIPRNPKSLGAMRRRARAALGGIGLSVQGLATSPRYVEEMTEPDGMTDAPYDQNEHYNPVAEVPGDEADQAAAKAYWSSINPK